MSAAIIDLRFKPRRGRPPVHEPDLDHAFHASEELEQSDRLGEILRRLHACIVSGNSVAAYHVLTREADSWQVRHGRRWTERDSA
jgi:hypothetical protein